MTARRTEYDLMTGEYVTLPSPRRQPERRIDLLILTMPDRDIVSLSLREGIDFIDEPWPDFGDFYILETA